MINRDPSLRAVAGYAINYQATSCESTSYHIAMIIYHCWLFLAIVGLLLKHDLATNSRANLPSIDH